MKIARMVGVAVVVATLSLQVGTAGAAAAVDQSQTAVNDEQPIPGNPSFPAYRVAQTFTAGVTGTLDQVDMLLRRQFNPGDLNVEIRSVASGVPTNTVLATATVSESSVPSGGPSVWVSVPFNAPAPSTAGTQYAIIVYAPSGFCGGDCWMWSGAVADPYAGGAALFAVDGVNWVGNEAQLDFAFKTYVSPGLPLPTSKEQCKDDGWRAFAVFKNQGDCVSLVEARGANM
jgi:hypothetical protein